MTDVQSFRDRLHAFQLGGLGISAPQLSPQWSASNPTFNNQSATHALTLTFGATWKAPFPGTLIFAGGPSDVACELDALPVEGAHALVTLHPQAFARLERLYARQFGGVADRPTRPVPAYIVIRGATSMSALGMVRAGEDLPAGGASFHDRRGLIIDPLAIASAFEDLLRAFGALVPTGVTLNAGQLATAAGFVGTIARLDGATAVRKVHVVDLYGNPWNDPGSGRGLSIRDGASTTRITGGGPFDFPDGATIDAESTTTPQPLRWGFATNGTLAATPFSVPALSSGATLIRDFIRVAAVHIERHVIGNRTTNEVDGVKGCDAPSAVDVVKPVVRDGSTITRFADGVGVLGALSEMLTRANAATPNELYAAAPAISDTFDMPADTTTASRWDQAASADIAPPVPAAPTAWILENASAIRPGHGGVTAAWAAATGSDVILTIAPGLAPPGAHVRVYPRVFFTGPSLTESQTLFRGDGAAAIAGASTEPVRILLSDPLNLRGAPRPNNPVLHFDLHVVPRPATGPTRERIFGGYHIAIADFSTGLTVTPVRNLIGLIPNDRRALCSSPVLGLPPRPGPPFSVSNPNDLIAIVKALASEGAPRESPRFPTMARTDAIGGFGTPTGVSPPERWDAALTGGFLAAQTHTELYHRGNPGGAAGPEIHAAGVAVSGQLGYDLALAASRRVQNLVSRLIDFAGSAWAPLPNPAVPSTQVGAVLQTIAPVCETPELSLYPEDQLASLPNNWNDLQNAISTLIPGFSVPGGGPDRLVQEAKREFYVSRYGSRDLQWGLRYAVNHARELIYIEAPAFQATASQTDVSAGPDKKGYAWDLVAELVAQLTTQTTLRLIVAVPKKFAFGRQYDAWAKAGHVARNDANAKLTAAAADRVVFLHPIGFPGRPLTIRTTSIVCDDVWCAIGTSAPRRRGFTFDGGSDLVWFDRALTNGRCIPIREYRRALMAQYFGVTPPQIGTTPDPNWTRLAEPHSAFAAVKELLAQGGRGLVEPLFPGPSDDTTIAQSPDIADPEGRSVSALLAMLVSGLADLESEPA